MAVSTRAKANLGQFMRNIRVEAGYSPAEIAELLKVTVSTYNRYEVGDVLPPYGAVFALLQICGADEVKEQADELYEDAKNEPKPIRLPSGTSRAVRKLMTAERDAEWIKAIAGLPVPGMLQTGRYARALVEANRRLRDPKVSPDTVVRLRLERQKRLSSAKPLRYHVILDEGVIRREVGGPAVMREQLEHILTVGGQDNVTVEVLPFAAGAYGPMSGPLTLVGFPESDEVGVYLEHPAGGSWVDDVGERRFTATFEDVSDLALGWPDSVDLINGQIRALTNRE
ncbi:helix-turn-helix domain-containing protein [Amycolatopsis sp. NPDC059657]|uniref:helix-turn-helix domain-containing protein n=1 Tax=Amycolatopsis sp. NPDC059657 TaxID=3346899 RepID=UPI00366ED141